MTDQNRTEVDRLQYIQPEGSLEQQPPPEDSRIKRWMVLDGRRVQRHGSLGEAWQQSRQNILRAAIFMLICVAALLVLSALLIGGVTVSVNHLVSPAAAIIAGLVTAVGWSLVLIAMAVWPWGSREPLNIVRDRYDLAHDEFSLSLLVVVAVLLPVALVVNYTVG